MNQSQTPVIKNLVLLGGGHAHVGVLKHFAMNPLPGVQITLITRDIHTPYSGMLPGYIAGHYPYDKTHIDLWALSRFAKAQVLHAPATQIDYANRQVICPGRPAICFDLLSINIGSQPQTKVPGAAQYALPIKPTDRFLQSWEKIIGQIKTIQAPYRLVLVGTGAGGVEMSLATKYRLQNELRQVGKPTNWIEVTLIGSTPMILPTHNQRVRDKFMRILKAQQIQLIPNAPVTEVGADYVRCGEKHYLADAIIWVTQASAQSWVSQELATSQDGFIQVNDRLQAIHHPDIFAAGDIADVINHPRMKSGVFAVRQGKWLAKNLRRALLGKALKSYRPQKNFLSLISTGNQYAVASRSHWSVEGRWVWKIKNWIDQRFMNKYNHLPPMADPSSAKLPIAVADSQALKELSAMAMRCGGCGAKVGSNVLGRVINRLNVSTSKQVIIGIDSPDDAAVLQIPIDQVMVQSVDYFRAFIDDPYLFGRIAANHSLGDIFAMGATPHSAMAIATLPFGREAIIEDQLYQLMSGALSLLDECHSPLVGGHSSEGAEMAFGLTVNGIAKPNQLLRKSGMQAGQSLILTKPIGTGTLFAADMRYQAKGRWINQALEQMMQSNQSASKILQQHGVSACTDVTGFGLLGHLVEMTRASHVDVQINTQALPILDGAVNCVERGIFSSLQPQNIRLRRAILDNGFDREQAIYKLLFDPQTAGGLLASVPENQATDCLHQLKQAGYRQAAIIGHCMTRGQQAQSICLT